MLYHLLVVSSQLAPTTPVAAGTINLNLAGCGSTKGCYRTPPGCGVNDCDAVATWTPLPDADTGQSYVMFEMQSSNRWMALGFSADESMVRALVTTKRRITANIFSGIHHKIASVD